MTGLLLDPAYRDHATARGHPESASRIDALLDAFAKEAALAASLPIAPRPATFEEIARAHDPRYVEAVLAAIAGGATELAQGDVSVGPRSDEIARLATGGVLAAVDAVLAGSMDRAFCAVRPPGHHATARRAMGFCIFNHVAIAARHAQAAHGVARVAILDWDVHHGNGTQDIFYDDGSVLFCSTHQSPWYPGTGPADQRGTGAGVGLTINRPFPAGAGRSEIRGAFRETFLPAVEDFRPELILISAGFDARAGDPLGQFQLTDADFADLTLDVLASASRVGAPVVSVLEGGYSLPGLAAAATAHFRSLHRGGDGGARKALPPLQPTP